MQMMKGMKLCGKKCGELVNAVSKYMLRSHVGCTNAMDANNDGFMNALQMRIDTKKEGPIDHGE